MARCPSLELSQGTVQATRLATFAEKGSFPLAGGVLDQCEQFIAAMELLREVDAEPTP